MKHRSETYIIKNTLMKQSKGRNKDLAGTQENHKEYHDGQTTLRKHAYSNILKTLQPEKEIIQIKNSDFFFHINAQNITCGYSLEPPRRGGSNEYPQSMFLAK